MSGRSVFGRAAWAMTAIVLASTGTATPQPSRSRPRLEAVAETKLLMEGLLQANFRGLERNLVQRPVDDAGWVFARGQSLIIAETGNLLLLRPPKAAGQDSWQELAVELRTKATQLARSTAAKDLSRCRTALAELAVTCNRCHQNFGQATRIIPFAEGP